MSALVFLHGLDPVSDGHRCPGAYWWLQREGTFLCSAKVLLQTGGRRYFDLFASVARPFICPCNLKKAKRLFVRYGDCDGITNGVIPDRNVCFVLLCV